MTPYNKENERLMTTGFLYDPRFLDHDPGQGHPESRERLAVSLAYLQQLPWFSKLKPLVPQLAGESWIHAVHASDYVRRAKQACEEGRSYLDTPDVGISQHSYEIARLAAGGALVLADQMMAGTIQNGFALLRPPGHHAEESFAMGFCLFNNIAILARYLQKKHGLEKILILDWDVHHGNGTQHTFYDDPSVFYISLHQYPFYPGTGASHETGEGRGKGATLNCPMPAGSGDAAYQTAFTEKILPKAEVFKPDAVLISAGFDAHASDPLAAMRLSTSSFAWMTTRLMELADRHSKGRIISLLEGGYHLYNLPRSIAAHLGPLSGEPIHEKNS
jgi:acetoin utilization deacetylase AcuC-like enzyme